MELLKEVKHEWKKNPVQTGFMGIVILFSVLSFLKPDSTDSILKFIGLSALNFSILSAVIILIWWFFFRK